MEKTNIYAKKVSSFIIIVALMLLFSSISVSAATPKSVSCEKSFLFAVPSGGWSSATAQLQYTEYYTKNGNNTTTFSSRGKGALFLSSYATSAPYMRYTTMVHSNGTSFNNWTQQPIIYGDPWQSGSYFTNSDSVTYPTNTSITGTSNAMVFCDGSPNSPQFISVSQSLNTN